MGVDDTQGTSMSRTEIDGFLYQQGHGVLSMSDGDDVYAIPVSFGYDGEEIYIYLIRFGEESKKLSFSGGEGSVCLTTYAVDGRTEWECVVVYGTLGSVPESEFDYMDDVMDDNGWFPSFYPPEWPITGVRRTALAIESVTGRRAGDDSDVPQL